MLIANIGNQHFGNLIRAKELIKAANDHGADLIKSYAITPNYEGSQEREFYEMCSFTYEEYLELIEYARSIGNDLFFQLHGTLNQSLLFHQEWRCIGEIDFNNKTTYISDIDKESSFALIGNDLFPPSLINANIIHSMSKLSSDTNLDRIEILRKIYNRNIGFRDKSVGINACLIANDLYNSIIIEKNLCLEKGILFKGKMLDETIYSVMPSLFDQLANQLMTFREDIILH